MDFVQLERVYAWLLRHRVACNQNEAGGAAVGDPDMIGNVRCFPTTIQDFCVAAVRALRALKYGRDAAPGDISGLFEGNWVARPR